MGKESKMMIEQAVVISYKNGIATIQCYAKSGCGSCVAKSACGTKALSALAGEKTAPQLTILVKQALQVGDKIEIGLTETRLLNGLFWLYIMPLIALISSALLFSLFIENELWVALGTAICTAGTFIAIKSPLARQQFSPIFLRKV